jgi:hypothetical protein
VNETASRIDSVISVSGTPDLFWCVAEQIAALYFCVPLTRVPGNEASYVYEKAIEIYIRCILFGNLGEDNPKCLEVRLLRLRLFLRLVASFYLHLRSESETL